jgi:hypothetical protein
MTDPKQAMQQALTVLESYWHHGLTPSNWKQTGCAITALRAALSSIPDVKAVPVAWMTEDGERVVTERTMRQNDIGAGATAMRAYTVPLYYASSAQKEPGETGMDERKTDGVAPTDGGKNG